ncbi:MAG TPA: AAA family ATPase [Syntrophales bacterium]|nr:AAA family ATPase [Syntrophales bacterium]HQN78080.1 AAA family ATPase [Syntrophales bacterium]
MSKLKKALEKARLSREGIPEPAADAEKTAGDEAVLPRVSSEINPTYVHTKIQHIDYHRLVDQRIISIHHCNAVSDRFKLLRTQVLSLLRENGSNCILIASANRREGRTTTAINMAISMAQQLDNTVLLVDSDFKEPAVHKILGLSAEQGLSDCLLGKAAVEETLINPGISRLVVLPGGRPIPNSAEILGAPRTETIFRELKERYADRYLIFDSPPLLASADSLILSDYADAILLVVEAERTTTNDLLRTRDLLGGKPVIGTIFTKVRQ